MRMGSAARVASGRGPTGEFCLGGIGTLAALAVGASLSGATPAGTEAGEVLLIHAGSVIAVPGEAPLGPSTVVVRDGRIAEIAPGYVERSGAPSIDLKDRTLLPGLIDRKRVREPSAKLELLLEQLAQVRDEGHKALVFSQFTSLLAIVRDRLDTAGVPYAYLDGRTRNRAECVERFENDAACPLFLVSLKAGGVGLNLTAAEYVYLLDPWWNPAVEAQAVDRVHRIGREKTVFVYRMTATDTVEDRIARLKDAKRELFDRVIGDIPDLSDWKAHFPTLESLIAFSESPENGAESEQ